MTKFSTRSAIPGRPGADDQPSDLDKLIFGEAAVRPVVHTRGGGPGADVSAAGDDEEIDDDPPPRLLSEANLKDRAPADRRKAPRRKSDYKRLPDSGRSHDQPEDNRRGVVMLVGTVVVVGVFGAVVWNAYSGGVRSASAETAPLIAAAGAFKSRPDAGPVKPAEAEQAGVFDRVEASPRSSRPVAPVEDQREVVADDAPAPMVVPPPVQLAEAATPPPVAQPDVSQPAPSSVTPAQAMAQSALPVTPVQTAASAPPPLKAVEPPAIEESLAGGFRPAIAANGAYVVQIASLVSETAARDEWNRISRAWPELFAAANSSIVRADVRGETRYRLRVAAFATPADADAFCTALKAKGRDCLRTRK